MRPMLIVAFLCFWYGYVKTESTDTQNCATQLNKYRKFILQAIISFEDVCDNYNVGLAPQVDASFSPQMAFFGRYQQPNEKSQAWQFFKMFMAQFNDLEFSNVIHEAVIERCRTKLQMQQQKDEKRNSVVLGKKQRFHSWGGKRSGNDFQQEHNDDAILVY